jgi:hypothetical protein
VLRLIKADDGSVAVWLTDCVHKWRIIDTTMEDHFAAVLAAQGDDPNVQTWAAADVNAIPVAA